MESTTHSGSNETNTLPFPQEIRDMIWLQTLAPTGNVSLQDELREQNGLRIVACHEDGQVLSPENSTIRLSLLRTSQQVYKETKDLFWPNNRITISFVDVDNSALANRILTQRVFWLDHIKDVHFMYSLPQKGPFLRFHHFLRACNHLESITCTCVTPVSEGPLAQMPDLPIPAGHALWDCPDDQFPNIRLLLALVFTVDALEEKGVTTRKWVFNGDNMQHQNISYGPYFTRVLGKLGGELWVNGTMWVPPAPEQSPTTLTIL